MYSHMPVMSCVQLPVSVDTLATTEGPAMVQHSTALALTVSKELTVSSLPVSMYVNSIMWYCITCTVRVC